MAASKNFDVRQAMQSIEWAYGILPEFLDEFSFTPWGQKETIKINKNKKTYRAPKAKPQIPASWPEITPANDEGRDYNQHNLMICYYQLCEEAGLTQFVGKPINREIMAKAEELAKTTKITAHNNYKSENAPFFRRLVAKALADDE